MGSVNIFSTGKSGLFANRSALATTGHNIANVNTEGYSRQRVEQVAADPAHIGNTVYGTGVRVKQVHRINDEFLTRQISKESKLVGQYEEKEMALGQAEAVFNEIGNAGLNRLVAKFFNEFRKLGNEPESEALRATVREAADQLLGDFHRISRSIRDIQKNIDVRIESSVREANELIDRLAHLNGEIKRLEAQGGSPADLQDARDLALKKLSKIADITTATNEKGEFTVGLVGVGPLLSGQLTNKLRVQTGKADPESGRPEGGLSVYLDGITAPNITSRLKNGRLGGLVESRDELLGSAMRRIDELAYGFTSKINELHWQGYNLNNDTGMNFFAQLDKVQGAAEAASLSAEVKADANNIATALEPDSPGDNRLIQFIAKMQHARVMGEGKSTFDDFYNATVADLATVTQKNKQVLEHQNHIITQLQKFRDSISGVSLDEETTNLVQFQHAFDASAKVIKVADEMLETVLSMRR